MRQFWWVILVGCSGAEAPDGGARVDAGPSDGNVSDVGVSDAGAGDAGGVNYGGLVINELAAAGEPTDWFELYNGGTAPIRLAGVGFSDDPAVPFKGTFGDVMLAPGGYFLQEVSDEAVGFKLGGDELLLVTSPDGRTLDNVDWNEGDSPAGQSYGRYPDGTGGFKTLLNPTPGAMNVDNAANLCGNGRLDPGERCDGALLGGRTCMDEGFASGTLACLSGCAGFDTTGCVAAPAPLVINEVSASGDDQIELFNLGTTAVSLQGWWVADSGYVAGDPTTEGQRYVFTGTISIGPGQYRVLTKDVEHTFGLGGADSVTLYDPLDRVVDRVVWTDGAAAVSYCRIPNGTGNFEACRLATWGAANQNPASVCGNNQREATEVCDGTDLGGRTCIDEGFVGGTLACAADCGAYQTAGCQAAAPVVVINEVTSAGDDLIEILNRGTGPADLSGWSVIDADPTNPPYVFAAGTTLGANTYLVLVKDQQHTFGLGGSDAVTLRDAQGNVVDATMWASGAAVPSWCRQPNGTGPFVTCAAATFGQGQ